MNIQSIKNEIRRFKMGRNEKLNKKIKDERRDQILSSALSLFAIKGLNGTKISDISKSVGISQGLFYHYFASKEEIFIELVDNALEQLYMACVWLEKQQMNSDKKIEFAIEELLKIIDKDENAARYHLLIAQASASDSIPREAKEIIEAKYKRPYEIMSKIIEIGQIEGKIKTGDKDELAMLFWTSINGVAIYKAVHGDAFVAPDSKLLLRIFI